MKEYKSELHLQSLIYRWFFSCYPEFRIKSKSIKTPRCLLIHNFLNPRSAVEGSKLNGCGLTKGFPDLTLFVKRGGYGALIMELKIEKEKPKPEQLEVFEALRAQGYFVTWSNNLEDAQKKINLYLNL